ncbi:hypothetical protein LSTR_LSTR013792 [Laodelphax striatellus]|uniref:WDR36/Utp21 N-terminal domain-containing protein n=1 Tax=Laodelphax striatellus TaxID=195883 RepID=A0A482WUX2_LAOST|nr:hypothetical protein LSTR_LSTR013792 [Laodelphax striatellus]
MSASQIFVSNKALGYVSNHIPLVTRFIKRRNENLVVTCVGRAFHTYGCAHFSLLSVSIQLEEDITCLGADTFHVYTACGPLIQAWRRGTELKHTYRGHTHNVHLLLPFGPHLISVDEGSNLIVWDVKDEDVYLNLSFLDEEFHITTIVHPSTYLNKILLGSEQGELQLWNIKTSKMIYKFRGWGSPVTVLEQAPAVDVVGVGLADGRIFLHNLKFDETILSLIQDWGTVTSISFRLDGRPIMATGSVSGHIVFWDLEKRAVASQLMNAHEASVAGMQFLPNEPLMVTSSPDNTLKMWIFDLSDDGARLLRVREGHAAPPTYIRFHGSNGHNILSSGNDSSLRIFNTQLETFNKSLGRASYNRKASKKKGKRLDTHIMPPITTFDSVTIRDKEWDSIAAVHRGLPLVTTWSYDKLRMGELKLLPDKLKPKNYKSYVPPMATCLTVTNCGNFVVIGYSTGHLERFNIQSGIHRCSYGTSTAHVGTVRGVVVDSNGQVVVSGGADGSVKFWIFKTSGVLQFASVAMEEPVSFFSKHRESSIVCIALDDFSLCLLDIDTRKVVRKFVGHSGQINDATFSPDMRWLVSAAMDSVIRVWDIPTGQLVDCFKFASVAMEEPVSFFSKHRESSIVCIALDDFSLCLLDIDTRKVVRKFVGHSGQINDATFSPDMRWLK